MCRSMCSHFFGARGLAELTQRPDNFFILRWVTVN